MRAGGVPTAALFLVLGFTISQVSAVGDIYLEGEEDLANEFLEVKENDASILDHLKRIKRNFDRSKIFSPGFDDSDDAITTESPGDAIGYGKDDDLDNFGSGSVDKADTEVKEKTIQVTFTVVEPYLPAYFNRDSPEFIDLSRSLANAVDQLFENLPGTQRSTLVRIQSSLTEEFSCKVTLDIVTSGYDNTDHIKDVLKHYITTYNRLGKTTVNDNDFSVKVIPANNAEGPSPDYPEPVDPNTFDPNIYNQNNEDQITGDNQYKPNIEDQDQSNYAPTPEYNQSPDQNNEYTFPNNNLSPNSDNQNNYGTSDDRDNQIDNDSTRGDGGRLGESDDIPSVSSEDYPKSYDNQTPYKTSTENTEGYDGLSIDDNFTTEPSVQDCPTDHIRCDETRCVEKSLRCNGQKDCYDGLDEADCPDLSCGIDDFRCENGNCIESSRRCDGVNDCLNQEDERGCDCRPDEFRCNIDGACIEERKRCDGIPQCSDGSDESDCLPWIGDYACHDTGKFRCADGHCISMLLRCDGFKDCRNGGNDEIGCPCRSDQWQCDHGSCIKRKYRCDGRVDCPTDRSDERNCLANRFFTCRNGQIIPEYLRCNRQYDCPPGDLSDEQNCPCGASDFKCDNGHCIPATKHCDRTHDCQDGSDERHCTYGTVCMAYEYECKSGMCVQAEARCNGTAECNDETDEIGCPCKRGQYPCRDGTCINIAYLCNGRKDCSKGEDEYNCKSTCRLDQFTCLGGPTLCAEKCNNIPECEGGEDEEHCPACAHQCDGKCIPAAQVCDNQEDCSDGSDEQHCQYCNKPGDFRCGSGECLPFALKCNDIPECVDRSDEKYCNQSMATDNAQCTAEEFQCLSDLVCIDARFYCDNHRDCLDGSDETNCPWYMTRASRSPTMITCHESEFTCYDGRCIPHSRRCDNIYDCSDFSDEQNCYFTACPADSWQCRDGQCIPTLDYCDGKVDCTDGTDESECNWTTQRTYVVPSTGVPVTSSNVYTERPGYDDGSGNRNPFNRYPDNNGATNNGQNGDRWNSGGYTGGGYPGAPGRGNGDSQDGDRWNPNGGYPDDNSSGAPGRGSGGSQDGDRWNDPNSGYPDGSSPGAPGRGSGGSQDGDRWNDPNSGYPDGSSPGAPGRGSGGPQDGDRWNDPNSGYPDGSSPRTPGRGSGGPGGRGSGGACSSNQWRCENGPCIDAVRRCDGHIDCPFDYSDEFDCPPNSSPALNLKTYPENQTVRYENAGGDVVFQCRDEGPQRANVIWRMIGRPIKEGSLSVRGRLEMYDVTQEDSGIYICEAEDFIGYPGSQVRVTLHVENSPITYRPPFPTCQPFEATCANGQCIPKAGVCDGRIDCRDKSDEENCHHEGMCEPNQFKCNNRKCILKTWICDSDDDCGDGSDEVNCGTRQEGKCAPTEFTCASKNQCIPRNFHCDLQSDCIDHSDEIGCLHPQVTIPPKPSNVRLNPGDTLILRSEAVGVPTPIISWRLNWGHVPAKCSYTNDNGVGILTCPDMQPEDSGAYSSEAINNRWSAFAVPDAIVIVNNTNLCPRGYFNSEARTSSECIPCFCFGKSTQCRSADLFTYNMPMLLGEGGTRLIGINVSPNGDVNIDSQPITNQYYYQPLRNGATITKFGDVSAWSTSHPYITLPESYNGNQLKSYGGHIKYTLSPQTQIYGFDDSAATIIIKGKYGNLFHMNRAGGAGDINIEARFTPEGWSKKPDGSVPATRADIMMVLDDIQMILLRADLNNAGVNITDFVLESADNLNVGLGAASLVEECTCPAGYEGLSCQKCSVGYKRSQVGPWLGSCQLEECPTGTYGDPASGLACKPCPCPLTNRENQFARTCSLGPSGSVICDCLNGYEGSNCEVCAPGYEGNPLIPGDSCQPKKTDNCDPVGTKSIRPPDECVCKVNVQGRYCNQCKDDSFFLSSDFRQGCATCFCTGVTQQCKSSNFRRKTISVQFNVPQIVDQIKIFNSAPASLGGGSVRYSAPKETTLIPELTYGEINVNNVERSSSNIYYWSMPNSFSGDKVTSYGGYLRYVLKNVPSMDPRYRNTAAHVQIISDNRLTFHYKGNFSASHDGLLNASIQLLEDNWRRSDGGEISRPDFLLALADVRTILIKATYGPNSQLATPVSASIDIAERDGYGPIASHVEECDCLPGYIGTSCEDCAAGYTRNGTGIYLESCGPCECNKKSEMCDPETGVCFNCGGNSEGDHCERCKPGYTQDPYGNCIDAYSSTSGPCRCDPRGATGPCDATGNCRCKQNVIGDSCNTCRPGTFGLESDNTDGCLPCYCSGVTNNCHEGGHFTRVPIGAPVLGDNYGGFSITDLNAQLVIKDHFVPLFEQSELMYTFQFQPDVDLYWSLPVLPGNRVLSYGGSISLRQKFSSENDMWSERGNDVILDGGDIRIVWSNPNQFQSGKSYSYQVPLKEDAWLIFNTVTPATRNDFMTVLRNLKRVLVRATVAPYIYETTIADVSMDTAIQSFDIHLPVAKGIEICMCPEGHSGTSCETCKSGYYQDDRGYCRKCSCNGQDCQLDVYGRVVCLCQPPYTGSDCSTIGLVMELHPTIHEANGGDSLSRRVTFMCKYRAPEPLTIKFYHQGHEQRPPKYFNESRLEKDGWHGKHVWHTVWDTRRQGEIYECHTITERGFTLGVLTTSLPEPGGDSSVFETTTPSEIPESTISVTIISPSIKIQEIGSSVNFTCQAQSRVTRNRLSVNWAKRDGELPLDRTYIDSRNGYLVITNLQVTDSGVYICETSDGISTAQASATLKVPGNQMTPPSVEIFPSVKEYYEGDPIELECRVKGNPTPTIRWQRNKPLPLSAENRGSFLIIESARVEDSGEYRCIASNNVGSDDRTAMITIRPRPSWPQSDKLTISNSAPTVTEGQSIRIVCTGSTNVPAGSIDWIRQDNALFLPNVRSENGVLYIDAAESANQGIYICRSPQSNVSPIPVLLTVATLNPEPEIYNITVSVDRLRIPTGGSGTVDCNPVGSPLPLVKWTKQEGALGNDLRQRDNTLIINNARQSDEGYYLCEGTVKGVPVASAYVFVEIERREMPIVKIWPEGEQAVILGAQFELHCRVLGGIPEPYVTWNRNGGRQLSPSTEIQPQNVLRFNKVDVNDEGEYTCEARNDAGSASASSVIKVRAPPEITITPSDYVTVPRGDQVNVDCRANGYPQPMVSISFQNRQIVPPQPGHATLRIPSASLADEGDYSCTAESVAGSITNQFLINVDRGDGGDDINTEGSGGSEIPEPYEPINNVPSDQFVIEGRPETIIYCNGSGSVTWSRADNMPLQRNIYQADTRLVIRNVSKSDSGEYVCSIYENNEVIQEVHISLVVVTAPKITLRPQMQTVQPGQSPSVECVVSGDDIIEVTWTRRDRPPSNRMQVRYNVLQFRQIEVEDAGQYECFARSRYANISDIAEVNVIEDSGRTMVSHDREQWAAAGSAVRLACNATRPNTRVVWTKDGKPVPRSVIKRRDGSLYIRFAQKTDSGRYVCNIQNQNGRIISSKYIILHIQGYVCLKTEFRCYDSSGCIDERLLCDGRRHCRDNSDEENCLGRDKRFSDKLEDPFIFDGESGEPVQLVTIEQPHTTFRVGDNVNVLCKIRSKDVNTQWLRLGTNQYIPSVTYGDGAVLTINGVTAADSGVYRCVGRDRAGHNSFDDFDLKVDIGSPNYNRPGDSMNVAEYTARLRDEVYLPCQHDLELPVNIEWTKEYSTLPSDIRTNQPNLYFESISEADAGTYICRVSNNRGSAQAMAILTVKGVVPRFDGKSYISLPTIKDAFREFDIEISFKPSDENGLILYNSQNQGREGDYIALLLTNGVPEFIMNTRTAQIKQVKADRPLQLNTWHTIRLRRTDSKVTMDVDNRGPFIEESQEHWQVLDLKQPLYIGGVPDYEQLPAELAEATGFIGCVGMLILGREEKNIMIDSIEQIGISDCESCLPNLCLNNGFCQEARNERGYMCICATGYAGLNCDRTGEACRPGLCGPGKCSDTDTGYKCACPVTHTGKKCETAQSIEYPAFTGSAYLAIKPPGSSRTLKMSMNIKAATPVSDGIIMYCAESSRGYGGFTSLAVHDGRLEFRYDLGKGSKPTVLVSNRTLPANEWTNVHIARIGYVVSLKINSVDSYEERLVPPTHQWILPLGTPIFVGGVDDSITLNNNTGVSGGFNGCIKDFTMYEQAVDIVNQTIQSANVQECVSSVDDRGDIPEGENIVCQCRNGGQCLSGEATLCSCPYGFTGSLCEYRAPPSMRDSRASDPCAARPCRNGGSCRPNRSTRMNYSCDCLLGFAGDNCQIRLELYQSVAFNGDGYMELPASLINYSRLDLEPAVIALAIHTTNDGVLMYQKEAQSPPDYGDFIMLRIDRGIVMIEWDLGGGKSSVSVGEVFVNDGERHQIIAKLLMDGQVSLSVDSITNTGTTVGISNIMNADSNIYLGGIPDSINQHAYPGFIGCIEQFELMDSHRGLNLGQLAVAGRNTQRCKDRNPYREY